MQAKENAKRILAFDQPAYSVQGPPTHKVGYFGVNHEGFSGGGHHVAVGESWVDIWGTTWLKEQEGIMAFPKGNPLANWPEDFDTYTWPSANDSKLYAQIYAQAKGVDRDTQFLLGSHRDTLWEKGYMLVGMENLMCYMHTHPDLAHVFFDRLLDFQMGMARHYLAVGVDMVSLSDDLGTQNGLLFSPEMMQTFFMPRYKKLIDLYKENGVLVNFHSCGCVEGVVEMLMDLGIDILNPIQASANNLDVLRQKTQGKISLQGGVSSAVLMSGPKAAIVEEIKTRMAQLGQRGGYFCAPDQGMPYPPEHLEVFHKALVDHGRYPLAQR